MIRPYRPRRLQDSSDGNTSRLIFGMSEIARGLEIISSQLDEIIKKSDKHIEPTTKPQR